MGLFHAYIYRYAYSTRIYIGTLATRPHFFLGGGVSSPGGDASPAGKGTLSAGKGTLSTGEDALSAHLYIYYLEILIDFSALHAPFKEIDMVNCTLE